MLPRLPVRLPLRKGAPASCDPRLPAGALPASMEGRLPPDCTGWPKSALSRRESPCNPWSLDRRRCHVLGDRPDGEVCDDGAPLHIMCQAMALGQHSPQCMKQPHRHTQREGRPHGSSWEAVRT